MIDRKNPVVQACNCGCNTEAGCRCNPCTCKTATANPNAPPAGQRGCPFYILEFV